MRIALPTPAPSIRLAAMPWRSRASPAAAPDSPPTITRPHP